LEISPKTGDLPKGIEDGGEVENVLFIGGHKNSSFIRVLELHLGSSCTYCCWRYAQEAMIKVVIIYLYVYDKLDKTPHVAAEMLEYSELMKTKHNVIEHELY
jgi:hypothetical protein